MYQVIKMYGDFEPWWFLDGWEEDVVSRTVFDRYEDAINAFQRELLLLSESFPMRKSKNETMVAFWDESDRHWCEECDEYLQRYHSLMLVESKEHLPTGVANKLKQSRMRPCKLNQSKCINYE
ncbi:MULTISPECIES: DUF1033 family protein [Streptococcus]|uniref:DUF1033 family protein n=1 Tax=Streptococcus TaxID=1301 RepID=UPI0012DC2C6D|nr:MULTISPECIES: DUF1033 family protein [Streptococcus]QHF53992.1 superoxide dismutase [Streptococcus sp. DAT741]